MTVGCYAQVAAVLWYLGKQRHQAVDVFQIQTIMKTLTVLNAVDTDWDFKS